jgi:hypothetical protein
MTDKGKNSGGMNMEKSIEWDLIPMSEITDKARKYLSTLTPKK